MRRAGFGGDSLAARLPGAPALKRPRPDPVHCGRPAACQAGAGGLALAVLCLRLGRRQLPAPALL